MSENDIGDRRVDRFDDFLKVTETLLRLRVVRVMNTIINIQVTLYKIRLRSHQTITPSVSFTLMLTVGSPAHRLSPVTNFVRPVINQQLENTNTSYLKNCILTVFQF